MLINIHVSNNNACAKCGALLTSGMVGARCAFTFGAEWAGLSKTAVFVAGNVQKDVLLTENECVIPWEVLSKHGYQLSIGVYGVNASGDIVIPTIYANVGVIQKGADPSGDESTDPTLPVWSQIQNEIGNLSELETTAKDNLVKAINEAAQSGGGGGTSDHRQLSNRDAENQHPISAIAGLQGALDGKQASGDYATSGELDALADIVDGKADASDIPSLDGYATEQWVENKGYLTEHQSLAGYATETYVNNHHDGTKQDLISDLATIRSGAERGAVSMAEHKLTYTGTAIQLNGVTQTFAQVKSACEDASKFVYLVYESRLYIPQYVTTSAIYFTCTYPTDTSGVMTRRITMMSNNTVTVNNTELAPKSYVDNHHDSTKQDALTAGDNITIENGVISAESGGGKKLLYRYDITKDTVLTADSFDTSGANIDLAAHSHLYVRCTFICDSPVETYSFFYLNGTQFDQIQYFNRKTGQTVGFEAALVCLKTKNKSSAGLLYVAWCSEYNLGKFDNISVKNGSNGNRINDSLQSIGFSSTNGTDVFAVKAGSFVEVWGD